MNSSRINGIVLQNIFHLRRSMEDLVDTFFWPTMDLVIWGFVTVYFSRLRGPTEGITAFLLGGLILWNIVFRAQQDISMALLRNMWNRSLTNLFSSPLTPWEFLTATIILGVTKIILTLLVLIALAFSLYSFNLFSLGFSLVPFAVSLIVFAWAAGIFITSLIIRFGMRIQSLAWSLIFLFHPISAVFYPVDTLPLFLQKIAWILPTAHIFEGMRQVLKTGIFPTHHLIWAFILNIIYLALAALFFNFMFEKAREKGSLARLET